MKKILILFLLLATNQIYGQFCETFNQYSNESYTNPSTQTEYNVLNNWGSICSTLGYSNNNGIDGHYLWLFDQPCGSSGSWVFNNVDFSGNWLQGLQFSYDFILFDGGQTSSTTGSFYIYNGTDPLNSSLVARYVLNNPVTTNDGWTTITPYIDLINQGNLPSNNTGYWEMVNGTDWDNLIQNVGGLAFNLDINNGGESYGLDNICMEDCTFPSGELFLESPICYYDLPYTTSADFLASVYLVEINGVIVMDFFSGYYDPQYIDLTNDLFIIDSPGEYVIEVYYENCYVIYETSISEEISIDLPSTYIACNGIFEETCVPYNSNYTYEWYGPGHDPFSLVLLSETECLTPSQTGYFSLVITDQFGCSSSHSFTVLDEMPLPTLGIGGKICVGDSISIYGQGFDNPIFNIEWFHNNSLVQTGGTLLQTSFSSGVITVEISYGNCETVSATTTIKECCPDDVYLSVDCETQNIVIENLPSNVPIISMKWFFNDVAISPQPNFTTSLNAYLGEGTYTVILIFQLSDGTKCKVKVSVFYREADCCAELAANGNTDAIANANFVNIEGYQSTSTLYGDMQIPILCDLVLDGSNSLCEEAYYIHVTEFDPEGWNMGADVYPGTWFNGEAGSNIDFSQGTYIPGQMYWLAFNAGPGWNPIGLPFIYGEDCNNNNEPIIFNNNPSNNPISFVEQISVFPNPALNNINLLTSFSSGSYILYDINGKVLIQQKIHQANTPIDLSKFNAGIYYLQVQDESGEVYSKKVIKN